MRGAYTAGVLDAFLDAGGFESILAVSAGACNALSYVSGQRGRNLEVNMRFCHDPRYLSLGGLVTRRSVFGFDFMFNEVADELVPLDFEAIDRSDMKLKVVCTSCKTGRAVYHEIKDAKGDLGYVRASSSLPLLSRAVPLEGDFLLDGGPADSIPIRKSISDGNGKNVVVLTRNEGYQKKKSKGVLLNRLVYRRYPRLVETIKHRYLDYNESLEMCGRLEKEGKALVIRPSRPIEISRFERHPENLKKLYENGYEDAANKRQALYGFLRGASGVRVQADDFTK